MIRMSRHSLLRTHARFVANRPPYFGEPLPPP